MRRRWREWKGWSEEGFFGALVVADTFPNKIAYVSVAEGSVWLPGRFDREQKIGAITVIEKPLLIVFMQKELNLQDGRPVTIVINERQRE